VRIGELAELSGMSTRALRHFESLGIICSQREENGYRNYDEKQVRRLFSAMIFRECGVELKDIPPMMSGLDSKDLLAQHHLALVQKKERIEQQILLVEKLQKGERVNMHEQFESFKEKSLRKNEEKNGQEVRERWGEDIWKNSQDKLSRLSEDEFKALQEEGRDIYVAIANCQREGLAVADVQVQELIEKHFHYLSNFGDFYTVEVYQNLGDMYVQDLRFAKFFNQIEDGFAAYMSDAISVFCVEHV
jgi:DNA-binding transcriptional MerR regulator